MNSSYEVLKNRLTNGSPFLLEAALARINYLADNLQITEEQRTELTTLAKQNGQNEILSVNERLDMLEECIIEIAQIVYA